MTKNRREDANAKIGTTVDSDDLDLKESDIPILIDLLRNRGYLPGDRFYELLPPGFREKIEPHLPLNSWRNELDDALFVSITPAPLCEKRKLFSRMIHRIKKAESLTHAEKATLHAWDHDIVSHITVTYDHEIQLARDPETWHAQEVAKQAAANGLRLHEPDSDSMKPTRDDGKAGRER